MMKKFILALISMSLLLASGCAHIEEYDTEETADTEETTEVQTVTVDNPEYYTRFKNDGISINVYNWGEYIPDGSEEGVLNLNAEFIPKIYIRPAQSDHLALPHSGKQCYQNKIGIGVVELL